MGKLRNAFQSFSNRLYDPGNLTDENIQRNRDMADSLLTQVSNPQIQHKNQGYAVLAQALNANAFRKRAEKGESALKDQRAQEMGAFLGGLDLTEPQRTAIRNAPDAIRSGLAGSVAQHQLTPAPPKDNRSQFRREFEDYQLDGGQKDWEEYLIFKRPPGTTINTGEGGFGPDNPVSILSNKHKGYPAAQANREEISKAKVQYDATNEAQKLLNSEHGIFSGLGSEIKEGSAQLFLALSDPEFPPEELAGMFQTLYNSEAYDSAGGVLVGSIIRLFGSGTGLSDADREYAAKISGALRGKSKGGLNAILNRISRDTRREIELYNSGLDAYETSGIIDAKAHFPPIELGEDTSLTIQEQADAYMRGDF